MRKMILLTLTALALGGCADSDVGGRLVVRSDMNTDPTCATATADGSLCVAGALETNGALDVAGASTLTGAVTTAGATTHTGAVTASSTLAVTGLATLSGGLEVQGGDPVAVPLDSLRFCGQGPNATTAVYLSPDTFDGNGTLPGSAHCDSEDNTTEATADEVLFNYAIYVSGMRCEISTGGTDDTVTFQLRDDTADVSGMTCNVTVDGASAQTCQVLDSTPATIAAGSALAMDVVASTDDDLSALDVLCTIYYTN